MAEVVAVGKGGVVDGKEVTMELKVGDKVLISKYAGTEVKLDGEEYYVQEIFDSSELIANLDRNAIPVEHSIYDHVIYDSGIESRFAAALDTDPDVKMFFKIPRRFKIETPIGTYNPNWAVYLEKNGEQKLYFVLETKGTDNLLSLRPEETLKIHCGARHFKALDNVGFSERPVKNWAEFKQTI